jgi:hypothetical protein
MPENRAFKKGAPVAKPNIQTNRAVMSPPTARILNSLTRKDKVLANKVSKRLRNIFFMVLPIFCNIPALLFA